eukprot:9502429-Pyramimonas_sp.AAC.2
MNQTYQAFNRTPVSSLRSLRCRGASDPRDTDPGGETPGGGGARWESYSRESAECSGICQCICIAE